MTLELPIDELIDTLIDYRGKTPTKTAFGVPLITAKVIKQGRILPEPREYIAEDAYDTWMRRGLPAKGDILVTTEAPLGEVAQVPEDARVALAQRVILLRPDPLKVDPQFLFHFLRSPLARERLEQRSSGTTVTGIRQPELRAVLVPLLERRAQEAVGQVLDSLDKLIENNRRRVEVLEEMARVVYREWFVHFRYPGHESTALVGSPLGLVPEGWSTPSLFDVADVGFGFSYKSKYFASVGPYPIVRIRDVPGGITSTFSDEAAAERYRVIDGDVLVGMDGDFHLRQWTGGEAWLNQRVARLRPMSGMAGMHLMFALEGPISAWNAAIVGTTVAHLGKSHLEQIHVLVPPAELLGAATELFEQASSQMTALIQASRRLASIRDMLLPKLVSGQLKCQR